MFNMVRDDARVSTRFTDADGGLHIVYDAEASWWQVVRSAASFCGVVLHVASPGHPGSSSGDAGQVTLG